MPNTKTEGYNYFIVSFEHHVHTLTTRTGAASTTNPTNSSRLFSGLRTPNQTIERSVTKDKGKGLSRSKYVYLPIPIALLYYRFRALESGSTSTILRKLTSFWFAFETAKSSTQLDDAAKDPSTHYNSPLYRTHPHGYTFLFSSIHMVWNLPRELTPQLCSP